MDTQKLKDRLGGKLQTGQPKSTTNNDVAVQSAEVSEVSEVTEIITVTSEYPALTNNALEIINENLKNQPLSHGLFDIVKSPSGGTTAFTVPGLAGEEIEKEITGIILDYTMPRAYWDTPDPIEGVPPVCYSRDSIVSHDGKPCSQCVYNDFGTKNGGETQAKACKESVEIFLLRPDNILPLIVRVPVSSKMLFLKYTTRLVSNLTPISGVVTKIALEKATNRTGQPYALYNFEAIKALTQEEATTAKAFGQRFMDILNATYENDTPQEVA
ncbi:MAG: hypothetical protein FWB87_04260 [Defluviitaleaceae bacterium]|nr:hypothetical protein [Defluviitaleaceae bacterium]